MSTVYQKPTQTPPTRPTWFSAFSSVACAVALGVFVGGFGLLLVARWYVRTSVQEGADTARQKIEEVQGRFKAAEAERAKMAEDLKKKQAK